MRGFMLEIIGCRSSLIFAVRRKSICAFAGRRQTRVMKTLLTLLTMFTMQAAQPPATTTRTVINGTVTRAGSSDPIADAQVTLTIGIPAERISAAAGGVSAMGIQAASFQTASAQLMTM